MNFRHLLGCDTIGIVARNFKAFSGVLSFQELNIFEGLGFELSVWSPRQVNAWDLTNEWAKETLKSTHWLIGMLDSNWDRFLSELLKKFDEIRKFFTGKYIILIVTVSKKFLRMTK